MKHITIKHLLLTTLSTFLLLGCLNPEKVTSVKSQIENKKVTTSETIRNIPHVTINDTSYGQHTDEIQEFLSNTPMGSEIYLEQKESGEWYLKVEKTFTVQKDQEETKIIEPVYGESILI